MSNHIGRRLSGVSSFRMMPTDEFDTGASVAVVTRLGGEALSLAYSWIHPSDGGQHGALVVGAADEEGAVEAAWFDTWHQKPGLMRLTGQREDERITLAATYMEEWGWTIEIVLGQDGTTMTMCNVIPELALAMAPPDGPPITAGPYEVSVAEWRAP